MKKIFLFLLSIVYCANLYSYNLDDLDVDVEDGKLGSYTTEGSVQRIADVEAARITIKKDSKSKSKEDDYIIIEDLPLGKTYFRREDDGVSNRGLYVDRLYIKMKTGVNEGNKYYFQNGKIDIRVLGVLGISKNMVLGGEYESNKLSFIMKKDGDSEKRIETFDYEIEIKKALSLSVTELFLGNGVIGQPLRSKDSGTPGKLTIDGEPGEEVEVEFDKKIAIKNGDSKLIVNLTAKTSNPKSDDSDDDDDDEGELEFDLLSNGKGYVYFNGVINNTKKAIPGKYSGNLLIKVRYD